MERKKMLVDLARALSTPRTALLAFLTAGGYFLWTEHQPHLLAALPYLVFLLCPLMHLFMHCGQGNHRQGTSVHRHDHL